MLKITEWIRLTPKSLTVMLIFLFLVDLLIRFHWAGLHENPGNLRLVNEEPISLQVMKELIEREDGYKVVIKRSRCLIFRLKAMVYRKIIFSSTL